jgi:hypothetical protein
MGPAFTEMATPATSATGKLEEQYGGEDAKRLADPENKLYRMIDNASELADRLGKLNPANITVARTIFDGETHSACSQVLKLLGNWPNTAALKSGNTRGRAREWVARLGAKHS